MEQKYLIKVIKTGEYYLAVNKGVTVHRKRALPYSVRDIQENRWFNKHRHVLIPTIPFEPSVNLEVPYEPIGD